MHKPRHMWMAGAPALVIAASVAGSDAVEPPPLYASVKVEGSRIGGENCTGGDWTLGWTSAVAVEPGPLSDLLFSYTSFDTTQPNQEEVASASFASKDVTCVDDRGSVVMRSQVRPNGSNDVHFTIGLAGSGVDDEPAFSFSADELGMCHTDSAGYSMQMPVHMSMHTAGTIQLAPSLAITLEDLQKGFNKSYTFDGTVLHANPMCLGHELRRGTLTLRYKSGGEDPTVGLNACLHLARGEQANVPAQATPSGGQFSFTSSPGNVLAVRSQDGNTATVAGATPGKADLTVEYTRDGRKATAALSGSVVDLVSINNGAAIPTLGLYAANGMRATGTYDFPLRLDPVDGLVQVTATDDSIASVVNTSRTVQIQPVKLGSTSLQAKTLCGTPVGGPVRFEIVLCDDNVKQQLRTKQAELKGRIDALVSRITSLTRDAEFDRAASKIKDTTIEMATKTAESIIGTLSFGQGQQVKFATARGIPLSRTVTANNQAISITTFAWDSISASNDVKAAVADPSDWNKVGKGIVSTAVLASQNAAVALGKTYGEAYLAAQNFGKDLGIIFGALEQIEMLEPMLDEAIREYIRITTRLQFCESGTTPQPQPQPPKPGEDPRPRPPREDYTEIPVEQMPEEIPVNEEPGEAPPPIVDPPGEPGSQVIGLACRARDLRAPGVGQRLQGLRAQFMPGPSGTAFENLADANVDTYAARAAELAALRGLARDVRALQEMAGAQLKQLETAQQELASWQQAVSRFQSRASGSTPPAAAAMEEFERARDAHLLGIGRAGLASLNLMMETDDCRDRLEVKFDQVRTRYN